MTQTTSAAVTLDDVRGAIGDGDPGRTSASKVRTLLGRGSYETIQRHLTALRQEAAAAAAPEAEHQGPPPAPADTMRALWTAAYTAARAEVLARMERLAAERDAAAARADSLSRDVDALALEIDEQAAHEQAAQAAAQTAQAAQAAAQAEAAQSRAEMERVQAQAAHAAELSDAGRVALRAEMAHLIEQVSELKAALYQRVQQP